LKSSQCRSAGNPRSAKSITTVTVGRQHQEDVTSAALLYVIQADSDARRAVAADLVCRAGLARGAELPEDLFFTGQDHGEDGRPDIVDVADSARASCPRRLAAHCGGNRYPRARAGR
jgi:hypothetical protein